MSDDVIQGVPSYSRTSDLRIMSGRRRNVPGCPELSNTSWDIWTWEFGSLGRTYRDVHSCPRTSWDLGPGTIVVMSGSILRCPKLSLLDLGLW